MKKYLYLIILMIFTTSCNTGKEVIMPFTNIQDSTNRMFPIKNSRYDFAIRIWFNHSTSVNRVITIWKELEDSNEYSSNLIEYGYLSRNGIFIEKEETLYRVKNIKPKSGYHKFLDELINLNLTSIANQEIVNFPLTTNNEPYSHYEIEVKNGKEYHTFKFDTYIPYHNTGTISSIDSSANKQEIEYDTNELYDLIAELIFEEFQYKD